MDVFRMDAALDEIRSDYLKSRNKKSVWEKTNFQTMKKAMNFIRSHRSFCIL